MRRYTTSERPPSEPPSRSSSAPCSAPCGAPTGGSPPHPPRGISTAAFPPRLFVLGFTAFVLGGCHGSVQERDDMVDPALMFADLETRLLERPETRLGFRITAEGQFSAALAGQLVIGEGNDVALDARGTFGGEPVTLSLRSTGGRMVGRNGPSGDRTAFDAPVPDSLREAIVIGLTRMGLLHNLARLVAGAPPDRAAGGVGEWVQARELSFATGDLGRPDPRALSFGLVVAGTAAGDAVLRLDDRGRPAAREQVVRFPGGEMQVRESYEYR